MSSVAWCEGSHGQKELGGLRGPGGERGYGRRRAGSGAKDRKKEDVLRAAGVGDGTPANNL